MIKVTFLYDDEDRDDEARLFNQLHALGADDISMEPVEKVPPPPYHGGGPKKSKPGPDTDVVRNAPRDRLGASPPGEPPEAP